MRSGRGRAGRRAGVGADTGDAVRTSEGLEVGFAALLHEVAGLVDGSGRFVRLALSELREDGDVERAAALLEGAMLGVDRLLMLVSGGVAGALESARGGVSGVGEMMGEQGAHFAIDAAVSHHAALAAEREVRLESSVSPDVLAFGPVGLYPAIANGVRNAIEASSNGGVVEVAAWVDGEEPGRRLVVEVRDCGCGLAGVNPDGLFEAGYTTRGTSGGTGVGLAIVRAVAERQGGGAWLREGSGGGAVLRIEVPERVVERGDGAIGTWEGSS